MAIETIKLPDGTNVEINEWLHWPTYSTIEGEGALNPTDPAGLGFGASIDLRLFGYVVGGQVPQARGATGASAFPLSSRMATQSDTNQVARTRVNHDEALLVFSMTYEIFAQGSDGTEVPGVANTVQAADPALTGTNLRRLQRDCMYELFVGARIQKPQARAPLAYYGQGVGAPAWGSGDALKAGASTIAMNYGTGGCIAPWNQRRWQLPIYVHSDRVMYARLHSPVGEIQGLNQSWRFRGYVDGLKRRPVA
jgi:hypothetical protein